MPRKLNTIYNLSVQIHSFFLNLLFPKFCLNCGSYGENICLKCFQSIEISYTSTCFYCRRISSGGKVCAQCKRREKPFFDAVFWVGSYKNQALKAIVHGLKYDGVTDLAETLAEMLAQRLTKENLPAEIVTVPVPLHSEKEKRREFNQSELIARYLSKRLGLHGGMALKRIKETKSQVKLERQSRIENMKDAFACVDTKLILDRTVLLIDDVATTGSTLSECAKVLKSAGARKVVAAVVARG